MESEVVRMTLNLFHGDGRTCGTMTSGGSESILMAVKAYRDWAKSEKGITNPNLVAPRTAHPAFDKACQYFGVHLRKIDEDQKTWRADTAAMVRERAATSLVRARSLCLCQGVFPAH